MAMILRQKLNHHSGLVNFLQDQKSSSSQIKCQSPANGFFFFWQPGSYSSWISKTVNRWYYLEVLKRLREKVRRKRPEVWKKNSWFLHHDNAPAHISLLIRDFCVKNHMTVLPRPPYSLDLAPADFFFFPKLKSPLKGQRFSTIDEIKENSLTELRAIPETAFQDRFQQWKRRWRKCVYKPTGRILRGWYVSIACR